MNRVDGMQEDAHEFLVGMLELIESSQSSRYCTFKRSILCIILLIGSSRSLLQRPCMSLQQKQVY